MNTSNPAREATESRVVSGQELESLPSELPPNVRVAPAVTPFPAGPDSGTGLFERVLMPWARREVLRALRDLPGGGLRVLDRRRVHVLNPAAPALTLRVHDPAFYLAVALQGSVGAGESYARGGWDCEDLPELLRRVARRAEVHQRLGRRLGLLLHRIQHASRGNSRSGSRRNIQAHYDLGNEFFELFLDRTLTYSCGWFETETSTLREASVSKLDRVCRRLGLSSDDHVLEIGTGWGSFALHAATHYGCRVTTTTLSSEQARAARARVFEAGLADRVTVLQSDYRDLRGQYDKLVSIEMIEAVGHEYYDTFFEVASGLLAPRGAFLLQGILIRDELYDRARRTIDFIKHCIFPGSCIPSLGVLRRSVARMTDLGEHECFTMGRHYAETLRRWRESLDGRWAEAQGLGVSREFLRLWRFYFAYCEAGFLDGRLDVAQVLWGKPGWTAPPDPSTTKVEGHA